MPERITASRGMAAAGHRATAQAATAALAAGGNAFDAAVAAGFAAAVAEPTLTGLGGGGFLTGRTADGAAVVFDFFVDTPGRGAGSASLVPHFVPVTVHFGHADQVFNVGLGSVAVPGCLAGYVAVHERLGRLPLPQVLAPAVSLAREGVVLNRQHAYLVEILQPILAASEAGRRVYAPRGRPLRQGERVVNPELAAFLGDLGADPARAAAGFAGEALSARIDADMRQGAGLVTREDLAAYRVHERAPLRSDYRGHEVWTNPPPSFGGELLALSLSLLAADGPLPAWGTPAHAVRQVEAMIEAEARRTRGDVALGPRSARGTTHVSVCDPEGNVAAMTTSNGESSGYMVPGTGVMLNNMLGEDDLHPEGFHAARPGQRVASMMCPTLLLRDGAVVAVLGSGGSKRIRTALTQVICNLVDCGMDAARAVAAPRLHWDGEQVQAEPGFSEAALRALEARWPVNRWAERNLYFGGVHAVCPGRGGGGDPRRGGVCLDA